METMWKLVLTVLCLLLASVSLAELTDQNESCEFWASIGECKKNPRYMLQFCALSCDRVNNQAKDIPKSFYDIVEKDIHGNEITFDRFKGKVVYVVNVASQCGYTEENYKTFKALQKYYDSGLEIVLAPCNAFGGQEPGSPNDIYHFASRKGFSGIILEKDEVNGVAARPTFQYLKHATGKDHIEWYVVLCTSPHISYRSPNNCLMLLCCCFRRNFDGKFLVDREGNAYQVGNNIEQQIQSLLAKPATEL